MLDWNAITESLGAALGGHSPLDSVSDLAGMGEALGLDPAELANLAPEHLAQLLEDNGLSLEQFANGDLGTIAENLKAGVSGGNVDLGALLGKM